MLQKDAYQLQQYDEAIKHEWLETNGLGGWAGSTLAGCNTRCYHSLLMAATNGPADRVNLVPKLDEIILTDGKVCELGVNDYGDVIWPNGNQYLQSFTKELFPEWFYQVEGIQLKKTICMLQGENTTLILYEILNAESEFTMQLFPLVAARPYHELQKKTDKLWWDVHFEKDVFCNQPFENCSKIYIRVPQASYRHDPKWFYHFHYKAEKGRGLKFEEDLLNHGHFTVQLKKGDSFCVILSTDEPGEKNGLKLFEKEKNRRIQLIGSIEHPIIQQLALAADQFIVKRILYNVQREPIDTPGATVIAGYHWFTDWGRDTMISLPGLCLYTGRHNDAKILISSFAKSISMGMIPNRFKDYGEPTEYNNVDGTLWFFIAIYHYVKASKDKKFILKEILPVLTDIIDWHITGTRYHIKVDEDGLLRAGEPGQQLTWMDAKVENWVVTPRTGKPVEIQALWYNALCIYAELLRLNKNVKLSNEILAKAEITKASFNQIFWYNEGKYLYDVIDELGKPDPTLRPNQLFAISLPFPLIEQEQATQIMKIVTEKLFTSVGLRTLPEDHPNYIGVYEGNPHQRDKAYHQGTVWSWLLGPYIDCLMHTEASRQKGRAKAKKIIEDFAYHLNEAGIGTVSEIFDGNAPHLPRGCIAQAWSVAEILRVAKEYRIMEFE